ncbi:hypothetical protein HHI36_002117 [Cryptolaemus montrouzieri]|uniref:Uncharacterized protein n=1 Tax=Cryptolaemus montrouzieri TaxID=559131 RepID=A0ABD2PA14_9CUCU
MNKLQNIEVQFEDYVTCDEGLATTGTLTDAEIIDTVNQIIYDDEVDENDVDHTDPASFEPTITNKKARAAIDTLRTYVETCDGMEDHVIFGSLFELEKIIDEKSANSLNQKKIVDFF